MSGQTFPFSQELTVTTIDCQYFQPEYAASYLLTSKNEAAFVDTNTSKSVPLLLAELKKLQISPEAVKYLLITHIHLDHSGGTAELLKHLPNAKVVCHPRARRHLEDPSRLIASSISVYGQTQFETLYGQILPIASDRIIDGEDLAILPLGSSPFQILQTRGHANHHICFWFTKEKILFSGDAFGVAYPVLQKNGVACLPSTSPADFDGPAALATVERLVGLTPKCIYPTHFGPITKIHECADQLRKLLHFSQELYEKTRAALNENRALDQAATQMQIQADLTAKVLTLFSNEPATANPQSSAAILALLENDLRLNAQGLLVAAIKSVDKN